MNTGQVQGRTKQAGYDGMQATPPIVGNENPETPNEVESVEQLTMERAS